MAGPHAVLDGDARAQLPPPLQQEGRRRRRRRRRGQQRDAWRMHQRATAASGLKRQSVLVIFTSPGVGKDALMEPRKKMEVDEGGGFFSLLSEAADLKIKKI